MPLIVVVDDAARFISRSLAEKRLRALGDLRVYKSPALTPETLLRRIRRAAIIVSAQSTTPFTRQVLEQCPRLRHIAVFGAGTDHIDLEACKALGIAVTNTPGFAAIAVAEAALALALAVARRLCQNDARVRRGGWPTEAVAQLAGKTLGVLGAGPIARQMMKLGQALGMRVIAWTFHSSKERARKYGVPFLSLDDLLRQADVVSVHLPLTPQSRGLIGRRELSFMKPTAILVNTARGPIVDEAALVEALSRHRIAGAGLDVFAVEPLPRGHPLTRLPNAVLSPHNAASTPEANAAGLAMVVENIESWLNGDVRNRDS